MVKMVVFDLDGTLMNSLTDLAISVNYGPKLNGLEEKLRLKIIKHMSETAEKCSSKGNGRCVDRPRAF